MCYSHCVTEYCPTSTSWQRAASVLNRETEAEQQTTLCHWGRIDAKFKWTAFKMHFFPVVLFIHQDCFDVSYKVFGDVAYFWLLHNIIRPRWQFTCGAQSTVSHQSKECTSALLVDEKLTNLVNATAQLPEDAGIIYIPPCYEHKPLQMYVFSCTIIWCSYVEGK